MNISPKTSILFYLNPLSFNIYLTLTLTFRGPSRWTRHRSVHDTWQMSNFFSPGLVAHHLANTSNIANTFPIYVSLIGYESMGTSSLLRPKQPGGVALSPSDSQGEFLYRYGFYTVAAFKPFSTTQP